MVILETSDHYDSYGKVNTFIRKNIPIYLHRVDGDGIYNISSVQLLDSALCVFLKEESKWLEVLSTDTLFSNHVPEVVKPKKRGRKKK